jgi:hypothetical protein
MIFLQVSLPKPCMHFSVSPYIPHTPVPLSSFIWSPGYCLVSSPDHKPSRYAVHSTSALLRPNIFLATILSSTLSLCPALNVTPVEHKGNILFLYALVLFSFVTRLEDERFWT